MEGRQVFTVGRMVRDRCCSHLQPGFCVLTVIMPVAFIPSCPSPAPNPWFSLSCVTFGEENVDVPLILTLRIADKCSVGSREELVLNLCALFSDALPLIMRSRGFYRDMRGKSAYGEIQLWETGLKLSQNRPKIVL